MLGRKNAVPREPYQLVVLSVIVSPGLPWGHIPGGISQSLESSNDFFFLSFSLLNLKYPCIDAPNVQLSLALLLQKKKLMMPYFRLIVSPDNTIQYMDTPSYCIVTAHEMRYLPAIAGQVTSYYSPKIPCNQYAPNDPSTTPQNYPQPPHPPSATVHLVSTHRAHKHEMP